jgi:hypothetical protein
MKVTKTTTTDKETSATIDLFDGAKVPKRIKNEVIDQVGQYLVEQTLLNVAESQSPVQGEGKFKALSKAYKGKKLEEVGHGKADLQFSGTMLDEVSFEPTKDGIRIGVFGERAPAADGHNNLSGESALPKRRFIPAEGQSYKANIEREVSRIISDVVAENSSFKKKDFEDISSKSGLYSRLEAIFGTALSRAELKLAALRNEDLVDLLDDLDILDLL